MWVGRGEPQRLREASRASAGASHPSMLAHAVARSLLHTSSIATSWWSDIGQTPRPRACVAPWGDHWPRCCRASVTASSSPFTPRRVHHVCFQANMHSPMPLMGQPHRVGPRMSYLVFMAKPCTHRMRDPRSIVPHIRPKLFTDNQMS
jgi:hypothetical protein